jgi:hypothetical protein
MYAPVAILNIRTFASRHIFRDHFIYLTQRYSPPACGAEADLRKRACCFFPEICSRMRRRHSSPMHLTPTKSLRLHLESVIHLIRYQALIRSMLESKSQATASAAGRFTGRKVLFSSSSMPRTKISTFASMVSSLTERTPCSRTKVIIPPRWRVFTKTA